MISFGMDLVAGRKRVPIPATGKTALVTFLGFIIALLKVVLPESAVPFSVTTESVRKQAG
jgi:hypothetical protein